LRFGRAPRRVTTAVSAIVSFGLEMRKVLGARI
jgi:hypothetical protein